MHTRSSRCIHLVDQMIPIFRCVHKTLLPFVCKLLRLLDAMNVQLKPCIERGTSSAKKGYENDALDRRGRLADGTLPVAACGHRRCLGANGDENETGAG